LRLRLAFLFSILISMHFDVKFKQDTADCWIAEISEFPGVLAYGATPGRAAAKVRTLVLQIANHVAK